MKRILKWFLNIYMCVMLKLLALYLCASLWLAEKRHSNNDSDNSSNSNTYNTIKTWSLFYIYIYRTDI